VRGRERERERKRSQNERRAKEKVEGEMAHGRRVAPTGRLEPPRGRDREAERRSPL